MIKRTNKVLLAILSTIAFFVPANANWTLIPQYQEKLEVHYINVEQGACTLIVGPNGMKVLFDAGTNKAGQEETIVEEITNFLNKLALSTHFDYLIVSHRDVDHFNLIPAMLKKGYVFDKCLDNGSTKAYSKEMPAEIENKIAEITLGSEIELGNNAKMVCVAENGRVIGTGSIKGAQKDENDRSICMLVQYGEFDYILTGDLGGGPAKGEGDDTGRSNRKQIDVESSLVRALMPGGDHPMLSSFGVEVAHIGHHGSESSTNFRYMNGFSPAVACISVGDGQKKSWNLPRKNVVDNVLLGGAYCIEAESAIVLQTEEGAPRGKKTSIRGYSVGDIMISTDGKTSYTIDATGRVIKGKDERKKAKIPIVLSFDEDI
jgi:beta-lactamase superfamily II metal-dependent hydrolase